MARPVNPAGTGRALGGGGTNTPKPSSTWLGGTTSWVSCPALALPSAATALPACAVGLKARWGSFNGALVFVGLNALLTVFSYLVIVKDIKRVELRRG